MYFSTSTIAKAAVAVALISQVAALPAPQAPPAELKARAATHHRSRPLEEEGMTKENHENEPVRPNNPWQHISVPHRGAALRARMYIKEPSPTLIRLQKGVSCAAHGRCKRGEAPAKLRARARKTPKTPKKPKMPSSDLPRFQDMGDCTTGLCGPRTGAPTEPSPEVKKLLWEARDCTTGLCGRSDEAADKLRARAPARTPKAPKKPKTPKKPSPKLGLQDDMGDCSTGLCRNRPAPEPKTDCGTGLCRRGEVDAE